MTTLYQYEDNDIIGHDLLGRPKFVGDMPAKDHPTKLSNFCLNTIAVFCALTIVGLPVTWFIRAIMREHMKAHRKYVRLTGNCDKCIIVERAA